MTAFTTIVLRLALMAGLGFWATGAAAQEVHVLRIANFAGAVGGGGNALEGYARELEAASGGRLKVELFHGASMGPAPKHFDLVRSGVADLAYFSTVFTPGRFPKVDVFTLPNVIQNAQGAVGATRLLMKLAPENLYPEFDGVKVLWLATIAQDTLYTTRAPVRTLADLKGKQLRVASKSAQTVMRDVGAVPVSLDTGEVADALQKNSIDGIHASRGAIWALKSGDLVRYETPLLKVNVVVGFAINQAAYDALPPDLRALIDGLGGADRAAAFAGVLGEDDPAVIDYFANGRVETLQPAPDLLDAVAAASDAYNEGVLSQAGPELRALYNRIRELDKAGS